MHNAEHLPSQVQHFTVTEEVLFYSNKYLIAKPLSTVSTKQYNKPFTNDYPPNSLGLQTFHPREVVLDIKLGE